MTGENERARPPQGGAGPELAGQGSSSTQVYDSLCPLCGQPSRARLHPRPPPVIVIYDDEPDTRPRWMRELRPRPRRPRPGQPLTGATSGDVSARLRGILTHLDRATQGERNSTLHWAACRVGEMIAAGELHDPDAAADLLTDVALATGLSPGETAGTIRSGFRTSGVIA